MKNRVLPSIVFVLAAILLTVGSRGAEPNLIGKTVIFKISKESTSCIRVENYLPEIGPFNRNERDKSAFKVVAGDAPGTVKFEWSKEPGLFLQHRNFRVQILKDDADSATFRIVKALRGSDGASLQSFNFPAHYITVTQKGELWILQDPKEARKAVFFIQELPK